MPGSLVRWLGAWFSNPLVFGVYETRVVGCLFLGALNAPPPPPGLLEGGAWKGAPRPGCAQTMTPYRRADRRRSSPTSSTSARSRSCSRRAGSCRFLFPRASTTALRRAAQASLGACAVGRRPQDSPHRPHEPPRGLCQGGAREVRPPLPSPRKRGARARATPREYSLTAAPLPLLPPRAPAAPTRPGVLFTPVLTGRYGTPVLTGRTHIVQLVRGRDETTCPGV